MLVVCVFCAFYLVTVAYAWLTFFVTVLLAMLYGLLGDFSVHVLELRIAETAAGGFVGIASAYFIFSTGTRDTFIEKVNDYLDRLTDLIDACHWFGARSWRRNRPRRRNPRPRQTPYKRSSLRANRCSWDRRSAVVAVRSASCEDCRWATDLPTPWRGPESAPRGLIQTPVRRTPPIAALRDAADHVCATVKTIKHVVSGEDADPPKEHDGHSDGDLGRDGNGDHYPLDRCAAPSGR